LIIGLPENDEQKEIVRRIEELFSFADALETKYKTARAALDKLTPAILAKAFRGELVPQDPNDEPAEKLLQRIREARDNGGSVARRGRKRASA
jgi:type I restriction enzyme S subunit